MFDNVKAKKRLTQVIVAFVIICMTFTGSFLLLEDSIGTVLAADRDVSTKAQWDNVMTEAASGGTWNIRLTGNLTMNGTSGYKLNPVPAGATVNLNMNNFSITWDYMQNGGGWNNDMMARSYSNSSYSNGTHWGLITNNGTLNISGTGTIRNRKIHITRDRTDANQAVQRLATIVNSGNLTVGGNITIDSYLTHVHNSETNSGGTASYSDDWLYNFGIYSSAGTVTSAAKINVGGLTGTSQTGTSGRAYDLCYGIYGDGNTKVNVTGGNIYVDSFAGGFMETGSGDKAHIYAAAVGVYGNNALITGNTTINVLAKNWEYQDQNSNTWKSGIDHLFSAGIMYQGSGSSNSPILGPSVDVVASFEHIGDNKTRVYVPGAGDSAYTWGDVFSDGASDNTSHVATPVAGVSAVRNNIGSHTDDEKDYAAGGGFFGGTTPWASIGNGADANRQYRTVQSYFSGANSVATAPNVNNGNNDSTRQTASIVNGVPGNTGSGGLTNADQGVAGQYSPAAAGFKSTGSQYMVVYRYYKDVNNIDSVSFRYNNPARVDSKATMKVAGADNTNGVLANNAATLSYSSGANSLNEKYYEFIGRTYETVESANAGIASRIADINRDTGRANTPSLWAGAKGIFPNDGTTVASDKDNTIIVYMDYQLKDPTAIRIVAADKDGTIDQYSTSTGFTVGYTGKALVPGEDFKLGIIDMGLDTSVDTNDTYDDTVVTNVYDISGSGSGSGNDKTAVTYRYSADGTTWTNGLPKDAGTYKLEVNVNADTTFAKTGTYNRMAAQVRIDCKINPANVTISGSTSKTVNYGSAFGEIFDFNEYTATNKYGEPVTGTWSLTGVTLATVPNAGTYTNLRIVWTPDSANSKNYGVTEYPITLVVNKRAVTVNAGTATVTYGDAAPTFNVKYENLAAADESKQAGWLASTVFEVNYNGTWTEYYQGMPAGTYDLRIKTFGGAEDANNTFSTNSTTDKITVNKRAIVYNAVAAEKTYDESANVNVTLTYVSGNYGADPFDSTINATGSMVNANAGANKAVTVNTDAITIQNANNYYLVVDNAAALVVNVAKADPTGVSVVANPATVTYNKANTLGSTIGLDATVNTKIPGTWAWKAATTVPTVSKTSYVAVFTPNDTTNYNNLEQNVNLTVEQAHVEVTVDPVTVTYGDAVPALAGAIKYNGFTGGDTLASITYEGNTEVSTDYTPGSGVEKTYTISVATTITTENYYFTAKNGTVTVNPKALTVTANNASITYGAQTPEFDASDVTATGFYGSDSLNSINATVNVTTTYIPGVVTGKVGTYPINVAVSTTNKNYTISYVPGTLTVEKAVLTVTPAPKTISFGADVPEYKVAGTDYNITGFVNGDTLARVTITGEPVFTTSYTSESYVNTYPVNATTINMSADNYTFTGAAGTIRVIKADPNVTTAPTASVVNSHTLAEATFDNSAVVVNPNDGSINVPGTFTFVDGATVPAWGTTNTYSATFSPDDDFNYNTVTVNVTVTVTVKTISGTPVIQGSAMAGSTLTVSLASMDPTTAASYTYQWYAGDTAISGATNATYEVAEADIGKTIYVVLKAIEANGFTGTATSAKTDAVIKALLETTAAQLNVVLPTGIVYDAMSHAATVTIADGYNAQYFGNITVKYNGSDKAPTAAGTYVVTVDVSTPAEPDGGYPENTYYGPATGIAVGTFTIARAPFTVTVFANDKVYDGTVTATASMTGSGLKDELDDVRLAEGARYAFADANAGTNKTINVSNVTLIGAQAANYEVVVEPVTATITPATLTARATGVNKTYDGTATVGVTFSNVTGYAPVDSASTVYLTNGTATAASANAGENILLSNIKYELAGSSKDNYVVTITNEGSATVTINKAAPTVASPTISGIVYDSTKPLSTIDLSGFTTADGYWQFDDTTIVPTVSQKTYAATYYSRNNNYTNLPASITVNITPKEVILTADNKSVTYGANAPTYTISASGFTGTDSLSMIGGNITATSTYAPGSDIGSYTITINEALTRDNYTFVTVPGYLTVSHGVINVTATAVDKVYDGNANVTVNFTVDSGVYANDDVRLSYASTTGSAATANAGTVAVSYASPVLVGEKAKNYQLNVTPKSGVLTVIISKADVSGVVFPADGQVEFGFDLTYATFGKPGVGDGTFAYENAKLTVPGALGVYDSYKVIFTPTDSRNYNTQEAVVSLQVVKCTLDYVVGIAGTLQSGQTLSVVTTGLPAMAADYISYQWFRYDGNEFSAISGATGRTYVATDDDVGYTLVVMTSFDSSDPYVYADGVTDEIKGIVGIIGETLESIKEIKLTFWQRLMNWIYRIIAVLTGIQLGGGLGIGG
ncbi:MAG: hypothetical protein IKM66_04215 [Clostridia bacterium]|nr:hypothetical protein [Clostridia bacterium]